MSETAMRRAERAIDPMFLDRWSPRAFTDEAIGETDLLTVLDAAHWAPSSYNSQPWRFLYARRGDANWATFLDLLIPFNQSWAKNAAALIFVVSNSVMKPPGGDKEIEAYSHSFDAGCAWGFLALQALRMGWATHGMTGFDRDRAFAGLNVPRGFRVEAAIAIGRRGDKATLPAPMAEREAPSGRLPLGEVAFAGTFPAGATGTP